MLFVSCSLFCICSPSLLGCLLSSSAALEVGAVPGSDRPALLHWCNSARIGLPFGSLCPDRLRRGLFLSFPAFSRRSSSFPAVCLQIALYFWVLPFSQKMPLSLAGLCVSLVFLVRCTSVKKGVFFLTFSLFAGRGVWQQFPGIPLPVGVSCLLAPLPVWVILHPPYCVRACYINLCGRSLSCRGARANRGGVPFSRFSPALLLEVPARILQHSQASLAGISASVPAWPPLCDAAAVLPALLFLALLSCFPSLILSRSVYAIA